MKDEKTNKVRTILVWVVVSILALIIIYVVVKNVFPDFDIDSFLSTVFIFIIILGLLGILAYFLVRFLQKKEKKDDLSVSTTKAIEIWKQEFLNYNEIPYRKEFETQKIRLIEPYSLNIEKTVTFVDPSSQTSDRFLSFIANLTTPVGEFIKQITLQINLGEKFIRENFNMRESNVLCEKDFKIDKKLPLTNSSDFQQRMAMQRLELGEDYTDKELSRFYDPLMKNNNQSPEPKTNTKKTKAKPEQEDNSLPAPDNSDEAEEEPEFDEVSKDVEEKRNNSPTTY